MDATAAEAAAATEASVAAPIGLDLEQLAHEAETTTERLGELIAINAIVAGEDGRFNRGDVIRSRVVAAFEAEGFSLEQIGIAIRERALALGTLEHFYPDPSTRTGRTFGEYMDELGERGAIVPSVLSAMGLSAPGREEPTRTREEALIRALIEGWSTVDDEYTLRAARIMGDAARRAAEGWTSLFAEAISRPVEERYTSLDDVIPRLLRPAAILSPLAPKMLAWLLERHLERTLNDLNIGRIEQRLERRGLRPTRPVHPPAVAFVDVSGFTRLTRDRGDDFGARTSVRLGELAEMVVRRHGGRVVKLLGDGVLLLFDSPCVAVEAVAELTRLMVRSGLPAAHAGVHAGTVVERDGDVFGTTVNVASRIANHAPAGTILVSEDVVAACDDYHDSFEPLGDVQIAGLSEPMRLCRWRPLSGSARQESTD